MKPFNITQSFIDSQISLQKPMVSVALETLDVQTLNEDDIKLKIESYKKELEQFCTYNNALIKHFQEPFNYVKSFFYNDFYLLLGVEFIEDIYAINLVLKKAQNSNNFKTFLDENLSTTRRVSQICLGRFLKNDNTIYDKFNEYSQKLNDSCTLIGYKIDPQKNYIEYEDSLINRAKVIHFYEYKPYLLYICLYKNYDNKIILNVVNTELPSVNKELLDYFESLQKNVYEVSTNRVENWEHNIHKELEKLLGAPNKNNIYTYNKSSIWLDSAGNLKFRKGFEISINQLFEVPKILEGFETSNETHFDILISHFQEIKIKEQLINNLEYKGKYFKYRKTTVWFDYGYLKFEKALAYNRVCIRKTLLNELHFELINSEKREVVKLLEPINRPNDDDEVQERLLFYLADMRNLGKTISENKFNMLDKDIKHYSNQIHKNIFQFGNSDVYFTISLSEFYTDEYFLTYINLRLFNTEINIDSNWYPDDYYN